jgi:hypothetical protein
VTHFGKERSNISKFKFRRVYRKNTDLKTLIILTFNQATNSGLDVGSLTILANQFTTVDLNFRD